MSPLKIFWHSMRLPLIWIGLILFVFWSWDFFNLPSQETSLPWIENAITAYGVPLVFAAALLESILVVGWYFPGGVVIFLSVAVAPTPWDASLVVVAVMLGLYLGYFINYLVGKYGWYRLLLSFGIREHIEEAKIKLIRHGIKAIFSSYWMPGLGALVATAAGILHYNMRDFLRWSLAGTTLWSVFWGAVVYTLGEQALVLVLNPILIVSVIFLWGVGRFVFAYRAHKKGELLPPEPNIF